MALQTVTFTRDFFFFVKKNSQFSIKEEIKTNLMEIEKIINISNNDKQLGSNNWRKPKSIIDKDKMSKNELIKTQVTGLLNKLSPKNYKKIEEGIMKIYDDNKDEDFILELFIDNIFTKAVMQSTYCPYYVKLINHLVKIDNELNQFITLRCNTYSDMLKMENKTSLTKTEKETYDEFCEKLKKKKYKAGYSQFIGELYNNNLINEKIITECINLFISNLENLLFEDDDTEDNNEFIEDNIICICNLIETTYKNINHNKINKKLIEIRTTANIERRLKFKIMDLNDLIKSKPSKLQQLLNQ